MTVFNSEPIYDEHEVCAVCGTPDDIGMWDDHIPVCTTCYADGDLESKFAAWLERSLRDAVAASPDFEQLPNGNYRRKMIEHD